MEKIDFIQQAKEAVKNVITKTQEDVENGKHDTWLDSFCNKLTLLTGLSSLYNSEVQELIGQINVILTKIDSEMAKDATPEQKEELFRIVNEIGEKL